MRVLLTTTLLIVAFSISSFAKIVDYDASNFITKRPNEVASEADFNKYDFDLYDSKAKSIFKNNDRNIRIRNFPINSEYSVTLNLLKQRSAFLEDIVINVVDENGVRTIPRPENAIYYGKIEGESNSDVFLTYSSLGLVGYIQNQYGQMYDISSNLSKLGNERIEHSVSETTIGKMINGILPTCGTENINPFYDDYPQPLVESPLEVQAKPDFIEVKIAADGAFEYYLMFCQFLTNKSRNEWQTGEGWFNKMTAAEKQQAETNAIDYMENIISSVSRIYNREVAVLVSVPYLELYTNISVDPYANVFGGNLSQKLGRVANIWRNKNNVASDRSLVTVFTDISRQITPGVAGIAYPGSGYSTSLCNRFLGYSALGMHGSTSFPILRTSRDVSTTAHEFGHNLSCPHTHYCNWPQLTGEPIIDSCVSANEADDANCIAPSERRIKNDGTIMSYCHVGGSTVLDFHPRMKKRIRNSVLEKFNQCTEIPDYPVIRLINPLGDQKLFEGENATIRFQAANVKQARILYSIDNGENWEFITNVDASVDTTYEWLVPQELTTNALVRIESVINTNVFDQSILPFSIAEIAIRANFPQPNMKIGYLSDQLLVWDRLNVTNVNVKFSLDNGNTYTDIITNEVANSKFFNFPDVSSDKAVLLIESSIDPTVKEVIPFVLGKETVTFNAPRMNDTLDLTDNTYRVAFARDFITDEFNLMLELNGEAGKLITNFAKHVDLETNTFDWVFGDNIKAGDSGKLTAVLKTTNTPIGQNLGEFYFEESVTNVGKQYSINLNIKSITPNPANESFKIEINNIQKLVNSTISIIGENGKVMKTITNQYLPEGTSALNVDVSDLISGTYFVLIETDKYKDIQQLKVVR